jgi:hypothetical protein
MTRRSIALSLRSAALVLSTWAAGSSLATTTLRIQAIAPMTVGGTANIHVFRDSGSTSIEVTNDPSTQLSVNPPYVLTIDATGLLTAVKVGKATVVAYNQDDEANSGMPSWSVSREAGTVVGKSAPALPLHAQMISSAPRLR